jgi:Ferritin-like
MNATQSTPKLLPRNVAALRRGSDPSAAPVTVAGNSVATRLESGIGNFFPGLECDLRNLERRFFPFLEIETDFGSLLVVSAVDLDGAGAAFARQDISGSDLDIYRTIAQEISQRVQWSVDTIDGDFGPLGHQKVQLSALDGSSFDSNPAHKPPNTMDRPPPDAWTAVRLLKEDSDVTLTLTRQPSSPGGRATLIGKRARYLNDSGALARMFEPGELTQSLCSPWTHDFRDCACYYWASNHPDIALPPLPDTTVPEADPAWHKETAWERADRSLRPPPPAAGIDGAEPVVVGGSKAIREMAHHEINRNWRLLNFVVERRERVVPYTPKRLMAEPLPDVATLIQHLRFAAGVEVAVMLEYLSAAWSIRKPDGLPQPLRDDVKAAFFEIRRIAIGEMLHLRAVNDVIFALSPPGTFAPALAVAADVPDGVGGSRPHQFRPADAATLADFVEVEAPSESVDGVYSRIYATLVVLGKPDVLIQSVRTLMSEGDDHYETFLFVQEWLGRHQPQSYLIANPPQRPPPGDNAHATLQQRYQQLLGRLHAAYKAGMPAGAAALAEARDFMVASSGIVGALDAVAANGFLCVFDPVADPRFAPIHRP